MKLHRLALTNFRGVAHREIEFPDHGIVVVSGPNETGKTSMLEALDLLLEAKDRSTRKEVKQVKPTHADVGAEVTAEISTGPYRFVYRKRFHKRAETELTLLTPRREQLTGDDAHDRVRSMLSETVDLDLWRAQRVLQSAPTSAADLSGCDALSRALDVAAGAIDTATAQGDDACDRSAGGDGGVDTLLIDRIDAEYRRYFTSTGRPTGEWAAAMNRLRAADEDVAKCAAAIAEVDEAVRSHDTLTAELAALAADSDRAVERLECARAAAQSVATLRSELEQAVVVAEAAKSTHAASLAAVTERRRLRADVDGRAAAIEELRAACDEAVADLATAGEVQIAADSAATQARSDLEAGQARVEAARSAVQRLADRDELARLSGRIKAIESHERDLEVVERNLAAITLTGSLMQTIDDAAGVVDRATVAAELASVRIELVAATDLQFQIGGKPVAVRAGAEWSTALSGRTGVEVPGVVSVQVTPGGPAATTAAALDTARGVLATALQQAGVADVAAARVLDERRRGLVSDVDRLRGILDALTGEAGVQDLRSRLAELRARLPVDFPVDTGTGDVSTEAPQEAAELRAELDAAITALELAVRASDTNRRVAEEAAKSLADGGVRAARVKEKLKAAETELDLARNRLDAERAAADDDQLAVKAEADAEASTKAQELVSGFSDELARQQPEIVDAALADAEQEAAGIRRCHDQTAAALREVAIQLKVYGTEGRKGRLDAAESEHQRALGDFQAVQRRARAVQLLRTVMGRHRDAARQRYVDPFRGEVERLGRVVFGESFEVDVDSELRIGYRTLSGRTVPYESLSGGAKEQLGIVARLAGAALVAKEDSVPVVIDDALGFSDAGRLAKMAEVFDSVASDSQVIVLTCSPQRYAGVRCAQHIELTAAGSD